MWLNDFLSLGVLKTITRSRQEKGDGTTLIADRTKGSWNAYKNKTLILWSSSISISNMYGDGRNLGYCSSDIVCVGFSWNDRGGGGGWRKIYFIIHILHPSSWP